MDAITLLKDDHRNVAKLFREFDGLAERAQKSKQDLVNHIVEELTVHAFIEEQIFYPFARQEVPAVEEDVEEGVAEHHLMKVTMAELSEMSPDNDAFDAKVTVLKEIVEHHVDEEEHGWFPKVRDAIGRTALSDVGEQMVNAKREAPTEPDPTS
jgi:hemerythrin superfamily protein